MLELLKDSNAEKTILDFYQEYNIQVQEPMELPKQRVFDANGDYIKIWDREETDNMVASFIF